MALLRTTLAQRDKHWLLYMKLPLLAVLIVSCYAHDIQELGEEKDLVVHSECAVANCAVCANNGTCVTCADKKVRTVL